MEGELIKCYDDVLDISFSYPAMWGEVSARLGKGGIQVSRTGTPSWVIRRQHKITHTLAMERVNTMYQRAESLEGIGIGEYRAEQ